MADLPPSYCYLKGQLISAVSNYDADPEPDSVARNGLTITVRALLTPRVVTWRDGDLEIDMSDITGSTDNAGRFQDDEGNKFIGFLAPDPALIPEVWKVTVTITGTNYTTRSKTFVPIANTPETALDWTDILEVQPAPGVELTAWQALQAELVGVRDSTFAARDDAQDARDDAAVALEQVEAFAGTNNQQVATMLTAEGPTKVALAGIAVPYATDWTDATRALHARQSSRGSSEVNALVFGADPTGVTDATAAINQAITTAKTFNVGSVFIPAGRYRVDGTIAITHEVMLRGQYMAYAPSSSARTPGTILVAGTNASGAPVIEAKNPTSGGYLAGVGIQDLMLLGSSSWTSGTGAKDRVGIRLHKVISEFRISGVMITGFLRQGIHMEEAYDGTLFNTRMLFCGTDGTYAALHLGGTAQGNTNSLHTFGLHVENCPYMLLVEGDARHNAFVASKFELFTAAPLNSPMYFGNSRETTFIGCYFVARNADDPVYADASLQPHFIRVAYSEAVVTLVDCNLNSAPYTGTPTVDAGSGIGEAFEGGARWVRVTAGRFQSKGGTVRTAWCGAGLAPFILQKGSSHTEATVYTGAKGGTRTLYELNGQARVTGCEIVPQNTAATVTSGSLFNCTGARNIIGPNMIAGAVSAYMATANQQTVIPGGVDTIAYTSGNTLDLGFVSPYATQYFNLQMAAATNVSQFVGGWLNREVIIRFGNANTTLVNSGNLILKGAVNANPPTNSFMRFIALSATVWAEISRSF